MIRARKSSMFLRNMFGYLSFPLCLFYNIGVWGGISPEIDSSILIHLSTDLIFHGIISWNLVPLGSACTAGGSGTVWWPRLCLGPGIMMCISWWLSWAVQIISNWRSRDSSLFAMAKAVLSVEDTVGWMVGPDRAEWLCCLQSTT